MQGLARNTVFVLVLGCLYVSKRLMMALDTPGSAFVGVARVNHCDFHRFSRELLGFAAYATYRPGRYVLLGPLCQGKAGCLGRSLLGG